MGGSGGYKWTPPEPSDNMHGTLFEGVQETANKFHATQVEELLNDKLKEINDHDFEAINQHRDEIEKKLANEQEGFEVILYGGSHARQTNVNGLSDIDTLAVLGDVNSLPSSSAEVIAHLAVLIRDRFPASQIKEGRMAVTITFSDGIEIQVLPAYRDGSDGFYIPNPENSGWARTCPSRVAGYLTATNARLYGKVVPAIKLIKAMCDKNNIDVKSYHLENMALASFQYYADQLSLPHMLRHFFNQAKSQCLHPISDPCGQTADITSDLSAQDRFRLADSFSKLETQISRAMASDSLDMWDELF